MLFSSCQNILLLTAIKANKHIINHIIIIISANCKFGRSQNFFKPIRGDNAVIKLIENIINIKEKLNKIIINDARKNEGNIVGKK